MGVHKLWSFGSIGGDGNVGKLSDPVFALVVLFFCQCIIRKYEVVFTSWFTLALYDFLLTHTPYGEYVRQFNSVLQALIVLMSHTLGASTLSGDIPATHTTQRDLCEEYIVNTKEAPDVSGAPEAFCKLT